MPIVIKGNKREVPPDMPILFWWERVQAYAQRADLVEIGWHNPVLEYLSPDEVRRVRAKALIWRETTGAWPTEIAWWWEIRMGRRRGDVPHKNEVAEATVDEQGVLHCGFEGCGARWSKPWPGRCKLCDRIILLPVLAA